MDIALYIVDLLHQHPEVNVPGLGTFFKQRTNGYYDEQKNMFIPPAHTLAFKLEQSGNLLLADYCCAQRNISQETAIYFIEKFTKAIWDQLASVGHADLKALGNIRKEHQEYILEAPKGTTYDRSFYGLEAVSDYSNTPAQSSVDLTKPEPKAMIENELKQESVPDLIPEAKLPEPESEIKSESHYHPINSQPIVENRYNPQVSPTDEPIFFKAYQEESNRTPLSAREFPPAQAPILEDATVKPTYSSNTQQSLVVEATDIHPEKGGKPIVEAILSFICLALIAAIGLYVFYPEGYKKITDFITPKKELNTQPFATIDSLQNNAADSLASQDAMAARLDSATNISAPSPNQTTYEIIVATFGKQSEAEKYIDQVKNKGINAKIIPNPFGPRVRVSCASFTNKEAADAELIRIKEKINPDAWLATIKPKNP